MALPALTRLSLWYAAGISLAVMAQLWSAAAAAAGAALMVTVIGAAAGSAALRSTHRLGLCFAIAGLLLATLALDQRTNDCRRALRDAATVTVTGTLQESTVRTARLALHSIEKKPCSGPIRLMLARATLSAAPQPGQIVQVRGEWWSDLNASAVDAPRGVLAVQTMQPTGGRMRVAQMRAAASAGITRLFGEQAPITAALLIAERDEIDPRVKQDFAASGLAHLLAISGTHVALVAAVIALLASVARLPIGMASSLSAVGSCAYVLFLGAPYPAVRAALQIVFVLVARSAQRPAHPLGLLAAAGLAILLYDPLALLDAGFQLSFSGLLGIVLWRRPLIEMQPHSLPLILRDAIATSVAASLATTPIAAYHFGQVSFIAVPANLVALPLVSAAVPAAALALGLSPLSWSAASFLADGTRLLLVRLENTAALMAAVPGGHIMVTRTTVLAGLAAVAIARIAWRQTWFMPRRTRLVATIGLACVVPIAAPLLPQRGRGSIEIHAIDVGQGDAIAIRSPLGRWMLVDAGPRSDRYDAGAARVVPFLLKHGARTLEAFVLTHPHLDHLGGAVAVANVLETRFVLDPDSGRGARAALGDSVLARSGVKRWRAARPGLQFTLDGMIIEILHPDAHTLDASSDPNDLSVIFRLSFGQFSALFTGDAPARVEEELVGRYGDYLDVDLLKIGHHGSSTSSGEPWLRTTTPSVALISAGRGNRYGHPSAIVLSRLGQMGVKVFRTDRSGNISLRAFRDGRIEVLDP